MTSDEEKNKREEALLIRLLFPESEEEWEQAKEENDALSREPGTFKIDVNGPPRLVKSEMDCPDCGKHLVSEGINFGDFLCPIHPDEDDCLSLHTHWTFDCSAWKWRWRRLWYNHFWGKIKDRWKSWRWKKARKKERSDPNAWLKFWSGTKNE